MKKYFYNKNLLNVIALVAIVILIAISIITFKQRQNLNSGASAGAAALTFSPVSISTQVGQSGNYNVFLNPNNESVNAVELYINYDPSKINVTNITAGPFFTDAAGAVGNPVEVIKSISNGLIHYAVGFPLGSKYYSTTANTVAVINFTAVAPGTSNFVFSTSTATPTLVSDINAANVLGTLTNGAIVVSGPSPSISPSPTASPLPTKSPSPSPSHFASPSPTPQSITGDVNQDGKVNIVDIGIVIDNYETNASGYPRSDVNGDGIVNIVDIGIVIDNYGI